jgi:hypothetical protein
MAEKKDRFGVVGMEEAVITLIEASDRKYFAGARLVAVSKTGGAALWLGAEPNLN